MEVSDFVFQIDADSVNSIYQQDNFQVFFDEKYQNSNTCAIYFSSNNIYYPNSEEVFQKRIVDMNFYEWYNTRIEGVYKHIFIRDIKKQWYISGINNRIDTPELLLNFLRGETAGYSIITLGSSAGGYAAVLYGSQLGAAKIFSFNGQFDLTSQLVTSTPAIDPLLFRNKDKPVAKYFDLSSFMKEDVDVYYFTSLKSDWDFEQYSHVKGKNNLKAVSFNTGFHGVPFAKVCLPIVINMSADRLTKLTLKKHYPLIFSFQMVGIIATIRGIVKQLISKLKK